MLFTAVRVAPVSGTSALATKDILEDRSLPPSRAFFVSSRTRCFAILFAQDDTARAVPVLPAQKSTFSEEGREVACMLGSKIGGSWVENGC